MRLSLLDYALPDELIAQAPAASRDGARLLVVASQLRDARIVDLPELVPSGALVVVNDTRVIPARLFGKKAKTGGRVEIFLVRRLASEPGANRETWQALGRSSKPMPPGTDVRVDGADLHVTVLARDPDGVLTVELATDEGGGSVADAIERAGHVPLPPYVTRADDASDRERYQTLFARVPGAVAAPTAGLHLSEALIARLAARGVTIAPVTLHVGLGTFKPVACDDLDDHPMHEEAYAIPEATRDAIAAARGRGAPVVAIGTTVVRALEAAADPSRPGHVRAGDGVTRLLLQPGARFHVADALLTNFHLPRSTLLALVAAFGGRSRVLAAYEHAVAARYRFYSYGDAMFIDSRVAPEEAST